MLDVKLGRQGVAPKDAATLILVRDARDAGGIEIFCVERSKQSRFMGGAIVFPGGKLDALDADDAWQERSTPPRAPSGEGAATFANGEAHLRALSVAACRETLEEAAILPIGRRAVGTPALSPSASTAAGQVADAELFALRDRLKEDAGALRAFLDERALVLDLDALHALARWITPEAESRRYDARFFVAVAPAGQSGAHDEHETMASFWATPAEVLRRYEAGEVQLAPPTHRTIALLGEQASASQVLAFADRACLEPICPKLVQQGDTMALVLPGDTEHEVRASRVPGRSRYVLRDGRWRSEDPPT